MLSEPSRAKQYDRQLRRREQRRNFSHLLVRYLPEIESSWKIKETGLRNEQTKRSGAESWLALGGGGSSAGRRGDRRGRASSLVDSGADIPGPVITNKFSTRNEVRKRERVNPKVRAKGVAVRALILGRRRTRGGNEKKEQEEGVESGERERKITLG